MLIPVLPLLTSELREQLSLLTTLLLIVSLIIVELFGTDHEGRRTQISLIVFPIAGVLLVIVAYNIARRFGISL